MGISLVEVKDPEAILDMLRGGSGDIIMDLPWNEKDGDEIIDRHKIILQGLDGNHVVFFNPRGHRDGLEKGTVLGGEDKGPVRTVERKGLESFELDRFREFFQDENTLCFYPDQGGVQK